MVQKNRNSIFVLSVLLLFGAAVGFSLPISAFAEVDTDKSVYSKGELVKISGSIDLQDDELVNIIEIEIINSDTDNTVVNAYTPLDDDNSFSSSYDSVIWPSGDYRVIISYNDVEETTEFEVSGSSSSSSSNNNDNSDNTNDDDNNNEDDTDSSVNESNNNTAQQQESSNVPNSPTNLNSDVISSTQIDLSWSAPDDSLVTGYKIEHRTNTDPNYSITVANTGNVSTLYSHTGLIPDTVYAYRVSTINSSGESDPSSSTTVKTPNDTGGISTSNINADDSDVPTDVVAKTVSSTSVELSWNPPTQTYGQTIQGYTIKQEIAPNVYNEIANTSGSSTKYTITNLIPGQTYTFVMVANYALGSSDVSEDATVTLTSSSSNDDNNDNDQDNNSNESQTNNNANSSTTTDDIPDSPTDLRVKPISSTQIDLSWSAPEDDDSVTGYKIEMRTINNTIHSTVIDNTESTDTTYSNTDLIPETTYIYRVSAINDMGISEPSSENLANTLPSDPEDSENTDTQQQNESASTQNNEEEDESDESNTTLDAVASPPVKLKATPISQSRIDLSWSAPIDIGASTLLGYKIESKTSDESDYSTLVTNTGAASTTTYTHTGLTAGLTYQYRIFAINSSGQSSPSEVAEVTIILNDNQQIDAQQSSSVLQPVKVTLNTDKNVYDTDDSIEISGIITGSTQNVPLGMRILSSDSTIVYVRSIPVSNDNTFETTIAPAQRQSSAWQSNGEFTVEATYNGRVQATVTFENNNENTNTAIEESSSSSNNQSETESSEQPQSQSSSSLNESAITTSNNELDTLKNQNIALQSANQQLRDENNQFKTQIEELNKRIEQLDAIVKEQIRVMMETLAALKTDN